MSSSKSRKRYKYFGYVVRDEWLLEYGFRNGSFAEKTPESEAEMPDEDFDEVASLIIDAIVGILSRSGLTLSSKIGSVLSRDGEAKTCFVLATNNPRDNLPVPPPESYARLKRILRTTKEPQWYLAHT